MKKSLKTLACVCVCMCAAALCFGKSKKESSKKAPAPLWLTDEGRRSIFPSSDFVSALAHGSSAEEAKNKAAAEISRAIKSSVASETKSRRLMAKDEHGVSINSFLDESASVKSESDLYMLEFTAPVYDGAMGMYACCAYINRSKAFEYVQPALENARRIFPDACQKALSEDDDFRKIIAIKRSHDLLKEFYSVYDFARFIKPQAAQEAERQGCRQRPRARRRRRRNKGMLGKDFERRGLWRVRRAGQPHRDGQDFNGNCKKGKSLRNLSRRYH